MRSCNFCNSVLPTINGIVPNRSYIMFDFISDIAGYPSEYAAVVVFI